MSTYDLTTKVLTVNGVEVTGAVDGDKMVAEPASEYVLQEVGADGAPMHVFTNNRSGQITMNIMYGERINDRMTELKNSGALFTVGIEDTDGATLIQGTDCRIQGAPPMTFGQSPGPVTWVILCQRLDIDPGSLNDA